MRMILMLFARVVLDYYLLTDCCLVGWMDGERRLGKVALALAHDASHARLPPEEPSPARPARAMTEAAKRIVSIWGGPREATPLGRALLQSLSHQSRPAGRYVPTDRQVSTLVIPCRSHCPPSENNLVHNT